MQIHVVLMDQSKTDKRCRTHKLLNTVPYSFIIQRLCHKWPWCHVLQCYLSCTSVGTKIEMKSFFLTIHEGCACSTMGTLWCQPPAPVENHLLRVFWPIAGMLQAYVRVCVCVHGAVRVSKLLAVSGKSLPPHCFLIETSHTLTLVLNWTEIVQKRAGQPNLHNY